MFPNVESKFLIVSNHLDNSNKNNSFTHNNPVNTNMQQHPYQNLNANGQNRSMNFGNNRARIYGAYNILGSYFGHSYVINQPNNQ